MKIYAVADVHGKFAERCSVPNEECLVFIAGDVSKDGSGDDAVRDLNRQFAEWRLTRPQAKFIMIAGNHDKFLQMRYHEMDLGPNARFLCDSCCDINFAQGLKIYGTSWCPGRSQIFECAPGFRQMMFDKIPEGLDVLITHSPPLIRGSQAFDNSDYCSQELTDKLVSMQTPPKTVICGHLHLKPVPGANDKIVSMNGQSISVYNVARTLRSLS